MAEEKEKKEVRQRKTISIQEKIEKEEKRIKHYEKLLENAKKRLNELKFKEDKKKTNELVELMIKSGKTEEEIRAFFENK